MTNRERNEMNAVWQRLDELEELVNLIVGKLEIDVVAEAVTDEEVLGEEVRP